MPSKNKGKRSREGSFSSDQDGDPVFLEVGTDISARKQLDEANAEISSLRE